MKLIVIANAPPRALSPASRFEQVVPSSDLDGTAMLDGSGTLVVQGDTRWRSPGHSAVLFSGRTAYSIYHAYDPNDSGRPYLRIAEMGWDSEGWPVSAGP